MSTPGGKKDLWLGLDLGASKILAVLVEEDLFLAGSLRTETRREEGPERVLDRALGLCRRLVEEGGRAKGVGVGFAGLVDPGTGAVRSSIMLPGWEGFPLARKLEEALGIPARADNDATAAGLGEFRALGSPPGLNMVLLTVGTGIGGALVLGGRLYRGKGGLAGELGNTTIEWKGRTCWCGNRGCLNTLASGSALSALARRLAGERPGSLLGQKEEPPSLPEVAEAARRGDEAARLAILEGARALGAGVANFINIFDPHLVVLTGGVTGLGETYLAEVRREAGKRAFAEAFAGTKIELSRLGDKTGAVGAACLAMEAAREGGNRP